MDELSEERKSILRNKQEELIQTLSALEVLSNTKEWQILKEFVFDRSVESIERQMLNEVLTKEISSPSLYRLQGERTWAKKYSDTQRFAETLKRELQEIKHLLK